MARQQKKWIGLGGVWIDPVTQNTGDFNAEDKTLHIIAGGQGTVQVTLPAPQKGVNIFIKAMTSDIVADPVQINPNGTELIDNLSGPHNLTSDKQTIHLVTDGADWYIL